MLGKLIGAQILSVGNDCIEVKKDGIVLKLEIITDNGDCCGFADFETSLLYSPDDLRNPVITNVKKENQSDEYGEGDSSIVTFFGESKELARIESNSGSGWQYGAFVSIRCKALDIDDYLTSW